MSSRGGCTGRGGQSPLENESGAGTRSPGKGRGGRGNRGGRGGRGRGRGRGGTTAGWMAKNLGSGAGIILIHISSLFWSQIIPCITLSIASTGIPFWRG